MKHPHVYPFIAALLAAYKATGKPLGIDAHLRIAQLVETLPDDTDFKALKHFIAPIIVGSPQQQTDFYAAFDRTLTQFDFSRDPSLYCWHGKEQIIKPRLQRPPVLQALPG